MPFYASQLVNEKLILRHHSISCTKTKNAVYWTPGMTMAAFIEESLAKAIEKLEEEKGEKFPQRERRLVGGRPMI